VPPGHRRTGRGLAERRRASGGENAVSLFCRRWKGHTFNTNLASHNRSVQDYLKVLKEKMRSNYIVIEGLEGAGKPPRVNVVERR
jgi:hypothetical protein